MELTNLTYQGPQIDDPTILTHLPAELRELLEQVNGFIQFGGGLHVRGACSLPGWHSLRSAWCGETALHRLYPKLLPRDIPFGQDALGDQFVLRQGLVHRLQSETGEVESLERPLLDFLKQVQADPVEYLSLHPLLQFQAEGGTLIPGQLLSAYPPFCTEEAAAGVSLRAVPAEERIAFLADFAAQLAALSNGERARIRITEQ